MTPPDLPEDAALFLDFDGCLVEIAPTPDSITIPDALPDLLAQLHRRLQGAVALISGRNVDDLRRYLPEFPGAIAGSHGAELALPGQPIQPPAGEGTDIPALHQQAQDIAAAHDGVLIEPKPHGVVLHYRARPDLAEWAQAAMDELAAGYPMLAIQPAKMAFELRPKDAGKDRALLRLLGSEPFLGRVPVYAGDDLTDEVAMAAAQSRGGFGIKIGDGDSVARYRLPDPAALAQWLAR